MSDADEPPSRFEKGEADGTHRILALVSAIAQRLRAAD